MLQCLNAEENQELRDFFVESGYNTQALTKVFGHTEIPQIHLLKLFMVGITLEPNRLNVLFRWFWIGSTVEESTVRAVIPERILSLFLKSGLVIVEENGLSSPIRISPFEKFLILSDHAVARKGSLRTDTVLWPNPTSMLCHHLSMQTHFGRLLDLGTGNGILALAASTHSGSVVATDLNARARIFCEFNAALNGITNIEFREGSAYEPVQNDRFDLILANPPFFVTPTVRRVYSDNGMELDGFCRKLVQEAHQHLNEGGYCQMLLEWVEMKGQPWRERLAEWFKGIGCDAWVLTTYMRTAVDYSLIRVQEDRDDLMSADAQAALVNTWQKYFESLGVEGIYGGMIVLRRREGPNWVRMEELQSMPMRPFGDFMRRIFDNRDFLGSRSDEQFVMSSEGWKLASVDLFAGEGLPYSLTLQPQVADFVAMCDGKRTLGEIADQTAASLSVDPALVRREICNVVRRVADRGMVVF
jgi:methylase of polypeptide subunit release factors